MSDERDDLAAIDSAARLLIPELTRRLEEHGLGEIEVRRGDLRLLIKSGTAPAAANETAGSAARPEQASSSGPAPPSGDGVAKTPENRPSRQQVVSPAVGIFVSADGVAPGLSVKPGQTVGRVDMLGVHYDVRAHRAGSVVSVVTESGEPVEYGQVLVEIEEASAA